MTLTYRQLTQASFLQKKSNVAKCCFDISEIAVWPKFRCQFSIKSILKLKLSKNVFYKKCGPKLIYISMNFYFFERFGHLMTLN